MDTLSAYKLYSNEIEGIGVWFRNTKGGSAPAFATFFGLEVERPNSEGIYIQAGTTLHFADTLVAEAWANNVRIATGATNISFTGGACYYAGTAGFFLQGSAVSIAGMDIYDNSQITHNTNAGVQLEVGCERVVVTGNKFGNGGLDLENAGVNIRSGVDRFVIANNTFFGSPNSILNFAGTSSSKVTANNAS